MRRKISIGVAIVLVVLAATATVVAMRPAAYRVERSVDVAAPAERVFDVLNDLRRFAGVLVLFGSPFDRADPAMRTTFEGPAAGVGQALEWSGSGDVGAGKMTIEESVARQRVRIQLRFTEPMESTATYVLSLAPSPAGTRVTWAMDGRHNFLGKAFGLFMDTDEMLGADIEKALVQLKSVVEATNTAQP